jgi:superfamily II DNA or RNA helicase
MNKQKNTRLMLASTHPELVAQWHPTKNGNLTPDNFTFGSNKYAWWVCEKGHEYKTKICHRASGSRCPYCYGNKLSKERSLAYKRPDLAKEFHTIKNHPLTPELIHSSSRQEVWWICSVDEAHEWQSTVDNRSKGNGCPYCTNRAGRIGINNSLGVLYPNLIEEWDYDKNQDTPYDFAPFSNTKKCWICKTNQDHRWQATIAHRAGGTKCPFCAGQKVALSNSLENNYPEIAREWHPVKNGNLEPPMIICGSNKKVWWQCIVNSIHEWKTSCYNRTMKNSGCPHCSAGWTTETVRNFIISLLPHLSMFDQAELYAMSQHNGSFSSQGKCRSFVKNFVAGKFPQKQLEELVQNLQVFTAFIEKENDSTFEDNDELAVIAELDNVVAQNDLPIVKTSTVLASIDQAIKMIVSADEETIQFFIHSAVAKICRHIFYDQTQAEAQLAGYHGDGLYANEVRKLFSVGYDGAKSLEIPIGYKGVKPNLMQRYVAYQVKTRKRFGNWSGTGAGKTLSAILASGVIGANTTVICCPNNVIGTWKQQIESAYPHPLSAVYTKEDMSNVFNTNEQYKYIILNYEFFQQPGAQAILKLLVDSTTIDLIVIDEIHYAKQRKATYASKRKNTLSAFVSEASNKNKNLSVLGMSATPVINELFEGKSLIELITGISHDELETKATIANCNALYKKFVSNGMRYIPNYPIQFNQTIEYIDCSKLIEQIRNHKTPIELEAILTRAKLPFILEQLRKKTIVYTYYRDGIEEVLREAIEKSGWQGRVALFNGDTKEGLERFIYGDADILIASSCIGTGIDGLQKVCNRLIINCLPWTHAEFKQLIGRIYRQGQAESLEKKVDIFILLTFANIGGERWSWCESRWKRIEFKKSIADAAVDGVIPEGHLRSPAQAHKNIMEWFDRVDKQGVQTLERQTISLQLAGKSKLASLRKIGDITRLNQQISQETSQITHKRFMEHPQQWYEYHEAYRDTRQEWQITPYQEAIKWCSHSARSQYVVGDFGCGEALLAQALENKVHSFDHIAINEFVIACDMTNVPLSNATLDVAIFSLSLMGTNYVDYLKEAYRCLKVDGHLWIAEPTSRIADIGLFKELLDKLGFDERRVSEKWKFTFIEAVRSDREINEHVLQTVRPQNILT